MAIRNRPPINRRYPHTNPYNGQQDFYQDGRPNFIQQLQPQIQQLQPHSRQHFPMDNWHGDGHGHGHGHLNSKINLDKRYKPYNRQDNRQDKNRKLQILQGEITRKLNESRIQKAANDKKIAESTYETCMINTEISKLLEKQAKLIETQMKLSLQNSELLNKDVELRRELKSIKNSKVSSIPPNRGPVISRISRKAEPNINVCNAPSSTSSNADPKSTKQSSDTLVLDLSTLCNQTSSDEDVESNDDCVNTLDFAD